MQRGFGKKILYIGSGLVFVASLALYLICIDTGASLWDCPEYILAAYRLEVCHPPGNPTWQLMANVMSHLAGNPRDVALAVNLTSAVATALATLLLYQIIFYLVRYSFFRTKSAMSDWCSGASAAAGALCMAWCDSVIFSAVEAEVYALSLFFTALMIWLMMKWAACYLTRRRPMARKILILTAYVSGLAFGVHELNLLAFTAMALIYGFTVFRRRERLKILLVILFSFLLIAVVLLTYVPGLIRLAASVEIYSVNTQGAPYAAGALGAFAGVLVILALIPFCLRSRSHITAAWSLFFFTLGCSTYLLIPIRAAAAPPVNTGDPSDPISFLSYFKREQYGSSPLFYGPTIFSRPLTDSMGKTVRVKTTPRRGKVEDGVRVSDPYGFLTPEDSVLNSRLVAENHGYLTTGYNYKLEYPPELNMYFPRMGTDTARLGEYGPWTGMNADNMTAVKDADGKPAKRPAYIHQLAFFGGYQLGYMYFRYLMWNFSGRQNNFPTTGEPEHGNFITGFPVIDKAMLGTDIDANPSLWKENHGHNEFYMLPLLVGLLGAIGYAFSGRRQRRASCVVFWLFFMTGIAIIFYLNQDLGQPRERDYAFLGSFMAFCIWIGFGVSIVLKWVLKLFRADRRGPMARLIVAVTALLLPGFMLSRTYDDHYRRGRSTADSLGVNILESLEPDAILFVDGDNYTFPVWYAQEVLGHRRDVAVVNLSYLGSGWYRRQLMIPGEGHAGVPMGEKPTRAMVGGIVRANSATSNPRPVYWLRFMSDKAFDGLKDRTYLTLHTRKLMDGDASENARSANIEGYAAMKKMVSGGRSGGRYVSEPYVSRVMRNQRVSALLLARRLHETGDTARAREVAVMAGELWPFSTVSPTVTIVEGDTVDELLEFSFLRGS